MSIYTDPNRLKATDPGTVENNPLWIFHDAFNPDTQWVQEAKEKYRAGTIGDVECKKKLAEVIISLLEPMQERRKLYANDPAQVLTILRHGADKANQLAQKTLLEAKQRMQQIY